MIEERAERVFGDLRELLVVARLLAVGFVDGQDLCVNQPVRRVRPDNLIYALVKTRECVIAKPRERSFSVSLW